MWKSETNEIDLLCTELKNASKNASTKDLNTLSLIIEIKRKIKNLEN
jgi:hypothetical protein